MDTPGGNVGFQHVAFIKDAPAESWYKPGQRFPDANRRGSVEEFRILFPHLSEQAAFYPASQMYLSDVHTRRCEPPPL